VTAVSSSLRSASTADASPNAERARASDRARAVQAVRDDDVVPYAQKSCAAARAPGGYRSSPAPACSRSRAPRISAASRSCTPRSYPSSYRVSATSRTAASSPSGERGSSREVSSSAARYSARYTSGVSETSVCSQYGRVASKAGSRTGSRKSVPVTA
jgi:hypothetical protein